MVNVSLGDLEEYAIRVSDGNLSAYLRKLIRNDKNNIEENEKDWGLQAMLYIVVGVGLLLLAGSSLLGMLDWAFAIIVQIVAYTILLCCSLTLVIYGYVLYEKGKTVEVK